MFERYKEVHSDIIVCAGGRIMAEKKEQTSAPVKAVNGHVALGQATS